MRFYITVRGASESPVQCGVMRHTYSQADKGAVVQFSVNAPMNVGYRWLVHPN